MNSGIRPQTEYYQRDTYGMNKLMKIQNQLKKQQFDFENSDSDLNSDSEADSTDSLQSQLGSKYRQMLIKNVTDNIKKNNRAAIASNLPDNQIMLMKFKKLRKDNKRMKVSIKELKMLLGNKDALMNDKKKDLLRLELLSGKKDEDIENL